MNGEWCRLRDSNTRPPHYECDALPTELRRPKNTRVGRKLRILALDCNHGVLGRKKAGIANQLSSAARPSVRTTLPLTDRSPLKMIRWIILPAARSRLADGPFH